METRPEAKNRRSAPKNRPLGVYWAVVLFAIVGTGLRSAGLDPPPGVPEVTNALLILSGVWALSHWLLIPPMPWIVAFLLGFAVEWIGLATGWPFGAYVYTGAWWPALPGPGGAFPLLLPFAWLLVAGASYALARNWFSGLAAALVGGLLAALFDLALLEPVMVQRLGFWRWLQPGPLPGGAPWSNFFAWWATAALAGYVFTRWDLAPRRENATAAGVLAPFALFLLWLLWLGPAGPPSDESSGQREETQTWARIASSS